MGKLTRSRVLRGRASFRGAPRGGDGARKFSPSCRAGRGWDKTKPCEMRAKTPSFWPDPPRPAPLPSLTQISSTSTDLCRQHRSTSIQTYFHRPTNFDLRHQHRSTSGQHHSLSLSLSVGLFVWVCLCISVLICLCKCVCVYLRKKNMRRREVWDWVRFAHEEEREKSTKLWN